MDADQEARAVKEFGISIPYSSVNNQWSFIDSVTVALRKARDAAINEQTARTWHSLSHDSTEQIGCWYCSWQYRFWKFWWEITWWSGQCEGCDNVMYFCGQACEFWEDDE